MLNPLMLFGLIGLGLPVVLHLIQRQRLRPQILATTQFLEKNDVANAFSRRPRDLLQLLLRLLLLLLFILLMSRLTMHSDQAGPRTLAVVLDQSLSMQQQVAGRTRFEIAKAQILDLIAGMGEDDRIALHVVGDELRVETGYLADQQRLHDMVSALTPADTGGRALLPTIRAAFDRLRSRSEVNPCVLVFSDSQRLNFAELLAVSADDPDRLALRDQLHRERTRLLFVDAGQGPDHENTALVSARFEPAQVHVGGGARLTAVVHNAAAESRDLTVRFYEGAVAGAERTIQVAADETVHVDVVHRFESPLDSACRAELETDALAADDCYYLPMRMKSRLQVLLVVADAGDEERDDVAIGMAGHQLLAYAMNPSEAMGVGSDTFVSMRRVSPAFLERISLPVYGAIVLYGVTNLSERSRNDLLQFVANGGGLHIILTPDLSPQQINDVYGGLFAGLVVGAVKEPPSPVVTTAADTGQEHPLLRPLHNGAWGEANDLHFSRYFQLLHAAHAQPLLRAENGDWLAALPASDHGRVVLQLFDCDLQNSSLPRTAAFVPMIQELLTFIGGSDEQLPDDVLRAGESMRLAVPEFRGLPGSVTVAGAETHEFPLLPPDRDAVLVEGLHRAGPYALSHPAKQTGRQRWLTVNPVVAESDLTRLSPSEHEALFGANVRQLTYEQLRSEFSHRHEILTWLLCLVLAALLVEGMVGAWHSRSGRPVTREAGG